MILAGDIGGTKTHLALWETRGEILSKIYEQTYSSRDFDCLDSILEAFLLEIDATAVHVSCFGVAGLVHGGQFAATNLPWMMDEQKLSRTMNGTPVKLINDLAATAYGVLKLDTCEFSVLQSGSKHWAKDNLAVIAAGTGLGEACLLWDGGRFYPLATEGGHIDFAAHTDTEIELLKYLRAKYAGHVSYERVLSGPGLLNIYSFLLDTGRFKEPTWLRELLKGGDPVATISLLGLEERDSLCKATLDIFVSFYGREAGNLALKYLALGGVAIGGGMAPKILQILQKPAFMQNFLDKGRFADLLREIEVRVVLNPEAALIGAAYLAQRYQYSRRISKQE